MLHISSCVFSRYCIRLYDLQVSSVWENKSTVVHYVNLVMEMFSFSLNFIHHLHILLSKDTWFSMAGFVILMQVNNSHMLRHIPTNIKKIVM